jgi:hypothetical protein
VNGPRMGTVHLDKNGRQKA